MWFWVLTLWLNCHIIYARGRSSLGRALGWQSRGSQFDPDRLHHMKKFIQRWPIGVNDMVCGCVDFTVPQRKIGDRYWVRITTVETEFITEWYGTPKQIDSNIWSWYRRGAEAVEVQLI